MFETCSTYMYIQHALHFCLYLDARQQVSKGQPWPFPRKRRCTSTSPAVWLGTSQWCFGVAILGRWATSWAWQELASRWQFHWIFVLNQWIWGEQVICHYISGMIWPSHRTLGHPSGWLTSRLYTKDSGFQKWATQSMDDPRQVIGLGGVRLSGTCWTCRGYWQ